ncbi:MAG: methylmalonyl-CoA mutase family protein, partial [Acidimicrobiales bacterium]
FFNAHIDFFEEIAKYRAARRLWARWLKDRYGARDERSMRMRFHAQTAGVSLTAQQPEVNIARTAVEALAAVLGGAQSLHTNSMDEAMALPTEKAARIALRTQQVVAHETQVPNVADPLGGSWFVEALTDEMERQATVIFEHLDELGGGSILEGVHVALDDGWFQAEIADAAYDLERKANDGRRVIVGVNRYTDGDDEDPIDLLRITAEQEQLQIKRPQAVKANATPTPWPMPSPVSVGGGRPGGQPHAHPHRCRAHPSHRRRDRRRWRPSSAVTSRRHSCSRSRGGNRVLMAG